MDGDGVNVCQRVCVCLEHVDFIQYVCTSNKQEKTSKTSGVSFDDVAMAGF